MRTRFYDSEEITFQRPEVFLAGPTASGVTTPWRERALDLLRFHGFPGVAIVPQFERLSFQAGRAKNPTQDLTGWEVKNIDSCDVLLIWCEFRLGEKSDPMSQPGFATRTEFGIAIERYRNGDGPKLVVGMPTATPGYAQRGGQVEWHCNNAGLPLHRTLESAIDEVITLCGGPWGQSGDPAASRIDASMAAAREVQLGY